MKGKNENRRIGRTRRMMHETLLALIVEKGYKSVAENIDDTCRGLTMPGLEATLGIKTF